VSVLAVPLAFLLIALIAVVFAALATAIGSTIKEMQGFQMVMNFLVMPIFFSRCALSAGGAAAGPRGAHAGRSITYASTNARLLIGRGSAHFGVAFDVAVLLSVGVVFVAAGAWRFSKLEA